MRLWTKLLACCVATAIMSGCSATKRYRVLSFFFDGVPEPGKAASDPVARDPRKRNAATPVTVRKFWEHGPYAAKLCDACHSRATNRLLMSADKLCLKCHTLDLRERYVHGPVAAGACRVCHEPHRSFYPFLLVAEPKDLCITCHDQKTMPKWEAHKGRDRQCTKCHDAHGSDYEFLLRDDRTET
jgi:predicted CXXCH cytochrome family protein